jgi:hypothetical protein
VNPFPLHFHLHSTLFHSSCNPSPFQIMQLLHHLSHLLKPCDHHQTFTTRAPPQAPSHLQFQKPKITQPPSSPLPPQPIPPLPP